MSDYDEERFWRVLETEMARCRVLGEKRKLLRLRLICMEARFANEERNLGRRQAMMLLLWWRLLKYELPDRPRYSATADSAPGAERTEALYNGVTEGRLWWGNDELVDENGDPVDGPLPSERFYGPRDSVSEVEEDDGLIDECEDGPIFGERVDPNWLWFMTRCFEIDEERGAWYEI